MGRFDGPDFERAGVVSVWLAHVPHAEIPEDYFHEPYGEGEDDDPWNDFSSDFGFGYYDHDFVEAAGTEGFQPGPITDVLDGCSYATSFVDAVATAAAKLGLSESSFAWLMFDFAYDPTRARKSQSACLTFVGAFPYDQDAR